MTADDIRITFAMDEAISLLLETGFSKPIRELTLSLKVIIAGLSPYASVAEKNDLAEQALSNQSSETK